MGMTVAVLSCLWAAGAMAQSKAERCRSLAPNMTRAAGGVADFVRAMESIDYDTLIAVTSGAERDAIIRMRNEGRKAIKALKGFQRQARTAANAVQACGDG
jgi:hypothetical protein